MSKVPSMPCIDSSSQLRRLAPFDSNWKATTLLAKKIRRRKNCARISAQFYKEEVLGLVPLRMICFVLLHIIVMAQAWSGNMLPGH